MLPSGNDAAQSISENVGKILSRGMPTTQSTTAKRNSVSQQNLPTQQSDDRSENVTGWQPSIGNTAPSVPTEIAPHSNNPQNNTQPAVVSTDATKGKKKDNWNKHFLDKMNKIAAKLQMHSSSFCNPHGLMNKYNHSSCLDMALLVSKALVSEPEFIKVMATQAYTTKVIRDGEQIEVGWRNTHKCFDDPRFLGGKTGITVAAGPCLASIMKMKNRSSIVVILLNCKRRFILGASIQARVNETKKIVDWVEEHYEILSKMNLTYN